MGVGCSIGRMVSRDSGEGNLFDEEYAADVREFLLRRGAVEYLSYLSHEPRRFVEMQDELSIGDGTLNKLHVRAEALNLRQIDQQKRDGKYYRVYRLTPMGRVAVDRMQELGVTQRHDRLRTIRQEFEHAKQDYLEWVEDEDEFITTMQEYVEMMNLDDDHDLTTTSPGDVVTEYGFSEDSEEEE